MKRRPDRNIALIQCVIDRFLNVTLLIISALFLVVGVYALVDNRLVIHEAEIPDSLKKSAMADREFPDIKELKNTNEEIIAWLTLDDTLVDYPITQAKDNAKYLTVNYKNEHSIAGNPFVDYRNNLATDHYSIIYGHRMNQKKMFGSLIEYANASYMQKHLTGTLTLPSGTLGLEVIAYSVIDITNTKIYDIAEKRINSNKEILKSISSSASAINGKYTRDYLQSDQAGQWRLLLLSTCDKNSKHYRDVLLLKIGDYI